MTGFQVCRKLIAKILPAFDYEVLVAGLKIIPDEVPFARSDLQNSLPRWRRVL
jgi:hypothetical protein